MDNSITLALTAIGLIALFCQWVAWRLKSPSIIFLLAAGILIGPVLGQLDAEQLFGDLLFPIVTISVSIILFEGSLTLKFEELKGTGTTMWRMLTIGIFATWSTIAAATHFATGLTWELSILFGAIMIVTGPTVIGPMLRAVRPTENISKLLRWEGIVTDPLGAVLAIVVFEFIVARQNASVETHTLLILFELMLTGVLVGASFGYFTGLTLRNYWLPEYLHNFGVLVWLCPQRLQQTRSLTNQAC